MRLRRTLRRILIEFLEDRRLMVRQVSGTLPPGDVWSGTIQVIGDVSTSGPLTILPGTVIKSDMGKGIFLNGAGTMLAQGTPTEPIIFTSTQDDTVGEDLTAGAVGQPLAGHWFQLNVEASNSILENIIVRYAGNRFNPGNLFGPGLQPSIHVGVSGAILRNVEITDGDWSGINVQANATLENVQVSRMRNVAFTQPVEASPSYHNLVASQTGGNRVQLNGDHIQTSQSWSFGGLPAQLAQSLTIDAELSLAPGTVIKVPQGERIHSRNGALNAIGTASQPIIFTSVKDDTVGGDSNADGNATVAGSGDWENIVVSNSLASFENVEVRYAGNGFNPGNTFEPGRVAAILVDESAPILKNVRVRDSENVGLTMTSSAAPRLDGLVIERSGRAAIQQHYLSDPKYVSVVLQGNARDQIAIEAGIIYIDRTWDYLGLPIHIFGGNLTISDRGKLTLAPGSILKFEQGNYLHAVGPLVAVGTASNPIVFTSDKDDSIGGDSNGDGTGTVAIPGQWESIYIDAPSSRLENVEVRYAGNGFNPGNTFEPGRVAGIELRSSAIIRDTKVWNSENVGIHMSNGITPTLENVRIQRSGREAIVLEEEVQPKLSGIDLAENAANRITWRASIISNTREVDFQGLPVHLSGSLTVAATGSLTLAPGTILKLALGEYIHVVGRMSAQGTPEQPIVFTSILDDAIGGDSNGDGDASSPIPGVWEAVYLDSTNTTLSNVEVRYAGNGFNPGNTFEPGRVAAINVREAAAPQILNTRIRFSENVGLRMESRAAPTLDGLYIEGSGRSAVYQALDAQAKFIGVSVRDNHTDRVLIDGGVISTNLIYNFGGLPAELTTNLTIASNGSLELAPGTILKFRTGEYLHAVGGFTAEGTPESPIIFTSTQDDSVGGDTNGDGTATFAMPGQWEAIYIDSASPRLSNLEIRYAGNAFSPGNTFEPGRVAALHLRNNTTAQLQTFALRMLRIMVSNLTRARHL